jgi:hypothetical protein
MRAHRLAVLPALAVVLLVAPGAPAHAQVRVPGFQQVRGEAYDIGYRRGYQNGAADARSRRPAEFRRDREYRDGDWGYDRRFGSRDAYRRMFQNGFEAGYREGYSGRAFSGSRRPLPPVQGYRDSYPRGRDDDRVGSWGYGNRGVAPSRVAFNYGYNDGYERGVKAARDRKRFDPNREGWYRDGDRHYDSDYGPRDQYRASYREGFLRGYEAGFGGAGYYRQ